MVNAESRASSFATLIAGLSMSARAPRFDAVAANAPVGLQGCEQETELLFHRARQEPPHAVLLPVGRLHHFFDTGPLRLAQQGEHALLLGHSLRPWFVSLHPRLGGGDSLGLRFNRSRRFLGVGSRRRDLTPGCRLRLGAPLLGCGALGVLGLFDGKDRHGIRLRWFAASKLTLARPKAPQIAGRALSVSPGGHVHRPAPIAMRPLRRKSSRFLSRGAREASQSYVARASDIYGSAVRTAVGVDGRASCGRYRG